MRYQLTELALDDVREMRERVSQDKDAEVADRILRELTRSQLKELERILAQDGYTDTDLRTAFRDTTNVEIAASIIGFIQQRAWGCQVFGVPRAPL